MKALMAVILNSQKYSYDILLRHNFVEFCHFTFFISILKLLVTCWLNGFTFKYSYLHTFLVVLISDIFVSLMATI